jgi:hypothetical protein
MTYQYVVPQLLLTTAQIPWWGNIFRIAGATVCGRFLDGLHRSASSDVRRSAGVRSGQLCERPAVLSPATSACCGGGLRRGCCEAFLADQPPGGEMPLLLERMFDISGRYRPRPPMDCDVRPVHSAPSRSRRDNVISRFASVALAGYIRSV